eukprot:m.148760 g.148760  ORF g.148760 m.148760 type:complete len:54 (+) comp16141_c1_seq6:733-894(+)
MQSLQGQYQTIQRIFFLVSFETSPKVLKQYELKQDPQVAQTDTPVQSQTDNRQ